MTLKISIISRNYSFSERFNNNVDHISCVIFKINRFTQEILNQSCSEMGLSFNLCFPHGAMRTLWNDRESPQDMYLGATPLPHASHWRMMINASFAFGHNSPFRYWKSPIEDADCWLGDPKDCRIIQCHDATLRYLRRNDGTVIVSPTLIIPWREAASKLAIRIKLQTMGSTAPPYSLSDVETRPCRPGHPRSIVPIFRPHHVCQFL